MQPLPAIIRNTNEFYSNVRSLAWRNDKALLLNFIN